MEYALGFLGALVLIGALRFLAWHFGAKGRRGEAEARLELMRLAREMEKERTEGTPLPGQSHYDYGRAPERRSGGQPRHVTDPPSSR
jgi:hypothetical protein